MTNTAPARTRTGTLTPTTRDPVRVTVALAPEDNLPTRASLDVFVRALLLPDNDWYLDVPWNADRDDGSTRLVLRRDYNDSAFAILVLDPEPASAPAGVLTNEEKAGIRQQNAAIGRALAKKKGA
jgi:hypothetical protein